MDEMISLRCKFCGAPLDEEQVKSDSQYVTCSSCGTTQQRMDAKQYLDQLMGQVKSWLSTAVPMGFNVAGAENIDPVARHSIFSKDVKPKIELELTEYKFSNMSLLGNCLIAVPFSTSTVYHPVHTSAKAFEFNAKVKSVSALAVDQEGQDLISDAASLSQSYAMMINNIALLSDNKEGRYTLMANNFRESANALKDSKGKELIVERFNALAKICEGMELLVSGKVVDARGYITEGKTALASVKDRTFSNPEYGIMFQGIEQEISVCDIVLNIIDIVSSSPGDPLAMLSIVKDVFDRKPQYTQKWGYLLGNNDRYNEVFKNIVDALAAKNAGTVPIAAGGGNILVPFWEVDLRYSFETGALWKKKSVEVKEDLLICADFVTDIGCLNDPASAFTDIFKVRPPKSILAGISGSETSISGGEGIGKIQDSVSDAGVGGREIMMPMSTKREAEKLCVEYLAQRTASDNKLKLSKPEVKRLVYVPCNRNGNNIATPESFGALVPARIGRTDLGQSIIM